MPTASSSPTTIRAARIRKRSAPRSWLRQKAPSEIGDRAEAIRAGIAALQPGDALLIAGKGHETGQIVGDKTSAVQRSRGGGRRARSEGCMSATPLWTIAEVARALGLSGEFPDTPIDFVTQDSRLVKPGCLFVALSGTPSGGFISSFASARDGWEFADKAEAAGAVAMIVPHRIDRRQRSATGRQGHADRWPVGAGARGAGALQRPGDRPDRQRRQDQHQGIPRRLSRRLCQPEQLQQFLGRAADAVQCQPRRQRCGWSKWA